MKFLQVDLYTGTIKHLSFQEFSEATLDLEPASIVDGATCYKAEEFIYLKII